MTREEFIIYWESIGARLPDNINELSDFIKTYKSFIDIWWDPDKFNWETQSFLLAMDCGEYVDVWWDPERYNPDCHHLLMANCSDKFDVWWDPKYISVSAYDNVINLARYCSEHLEKWWDAKKVPDEAYWVLPEYAPEKFNFWWNTIKDSIPNDTVFVRTMIEKCIDYIDIWISQDILEGVYVENLLKIPPKFLIQYLPKDHILFKFITNIRGEDLAFAKTRMLVEKDEEL